MDTFWNQSWQKISPERLTAYIRTFDLSPDPIIEYLHNHNVATVCDAGCGCGIYALKLAANGFTVSGFDISADAVRISQNLIETASYHANLKVASVLSTRYPDAQFDCVLSRDVLDHMRKDDAQVAVSELFRITKPGGILLFTVDSLDEEYEAEPHTVNSHGDYIFTSGKWEGMVFHPYSHSEIRHIIPKNAFYIIENSESEILIKIRKPA